MSATYKEQQIEALTEMVSYEERLIPGLYAVITELTEERKEKIQKAIKDGTSYGYDLKSIEHRYFFVEEFFPTDFPKKTPKPPMGSRVFNLTEELDLDKLPDTKAIAELLLSKSWS